MTSSYDSHFTLMRATDLKDWFLTFYVAHVYGHIEVKTKELIPRTIIPLAIAPNDTLK